VDEFPSLRPRSGDLAPAEDSRQRRNDGPDADEEEAGELQPHAAGRYISNLGLEFTYRRMRSSVGRSNLGLDPIDSLIELPALGTHPAFQRQQTLADKPHLYIYWCVARR
jgi:hypothetical protein